MEKRAKSKAAPAKTGQTKAEPTKVSPVSRPDFHYENLAILPFTVLVVWATLLVRKWLPGRRKTRSGYIRKNALLGPEKFEHREIAEEILGRKLKHWEVVHHINGRRSDNRPENLCVMGREDHVRYHEWYDWVFKTYGKYPRRETQMKKLREVFRGTPLEDVVKRRVG